MHMGANEFDVNCNFMCISFSFSCVSFTPAPSCSLLAPPSFLPALLLPSMCPAVRVIDNDLDCGFSVCVGVVIVLVVVFVFGLCAFLLFRPCVFACL